VCLLFVVLPVMIPILPTRMRGGVGNTRQSKL
jgi:hypothetical protein